MTAVGTTGREKRKAIQKQVKLLNVRQAGCGLEERRRAGSTNQHTVTDHHCGPIRYESVHGLKGPKHWMTADSMPMMLVEEQPIYDCIYTCDKNCQITPFVLKDIDR